MTESSTLKRLREEPQEILEGFSQDNKKRHNSYNDFLSILDEDEDGFESDLVFGSGIFTTLQQELITSDGFEPDPVSIGSDTCDIRSYKEGEEDNGSSVIRHLLEASDDELGIPSVDGTSGGDFSLTEENETSGGDFPFALSDGLWEFEDEAANYYSVLQSELFM